MAAAANDKQRDFISEDQAAAILGVTTKTLANWRCKRKGPSFHKSGSKPRYERSVVEAWLDKNKIQCG